MDPRHYKGDQFFQCGWLSESTLQFTSNSIKYRCDESAIDYQDYYDLYLCKE